MRTLGAAIVLVSALAFTALTAAPPQLFVTADRCQACHNGLITPSGSDVSIGVDWRASMMAQAARDPYWHAAVRRESLDHPEAANEIEHECSRCHMPMAHVTQVSAGAKGDVFANLATGRNAAAHRPLAVDGVSCSACHQIQNDKLGSPESFTGHFVIDTTTPVDQRMIFGPFVIDAGLQRLMQSATTFQPAEAAHVQSSEMCASCHTLYTHALDANGRTIGTLPEQVPYLEWRHSAYRTMKSCQTCHMPVVREPVRVSSALSEPREDVSRHTFRGSNFWMLRVLNRYREDLGVTALPPEIELAATDTLAHLEREAALLRIDRAERINGKIVVELAVLNRSGHKLPTAYPSRRVWLHLRVTDARSVTVFESGAVLPTGAIAGNDNDADGSRYEPHYNEIRSADQVQIYENILVDTRDAVTTGLLSGVRYIKDNRLLPEGFDKTSAGRDIAVYGEASADDSFAAGGDRIRYSVPAPPTSSVTVTAELLYQSVGHRWAQNLRPHRSPETDRFVTYYDSMRHLTTARLASVTALVK